jgi:DNA-binding transcriptional LysR family regulator
MDTDHLKIFAEVVRQGSFAAAARAMDIDPSAATRATASLERDLGLFLERTTRQLVLTEAGHKYHDNICRLLDGLQQATDEARDVAGSAKGVVRVTASVTYGYAVLLPLLLRKTFQGSRPETVKYCLFVPVIPIAGTSRCVAVLRKAANERHSIRLSSTVTT